MSTTVWRYALSLVTLVYIGIAFGDAFDRNRFGDIGVSYRPLSATTATVTEVEPGSDAERASVRTGDAISAAWVRIKWTLGATAGEGIRAAGKTQFWDARLGHSVTVRATALPSIFAPSRIIAHVLRIASLIFALVLFWRLPSDRAARALGGFILTYNVGTFGFSGSFLVDTRIPTFVESVSADAMWLMLALFACWFPDRYPQGLRRRLSIIGATFFGAFATIGLWMNAAALSPLTPPLSARAYFVELNYVEPILFGTIIVIALVADFARASALDRRRLEWLTLGMALHAYSIAGIAFFPMFYTSDGSFSVLGLVVSDVCEIGGTLCLLYGFLRYRVLDLSFAVNRAAVFAALSAIIVVLFVVVEYVVSKYVEAQSHLTGAAITLGAALAIGVSLRALHRHVDKFADKVIFRARYLADEALRAFGRRAVFVTDEEILRERTVRALTEHARAKYASLYQTAVDGNFTLSATHLIEPPERIMNADSTVLALKDRRAPLFTDGRTSEVQGEIIFPLFVRGELAGFVACGARDRGETYAPDDIATMEYALEHVAAQLDALKTERLERKLEAVEQLVRASSLLGADPARVLARIAEISAIDAPLVQEVPVR